MTQVTVGIRELKARLSSYIDQVKTGHSVIITDRGEPVARIVPMGSTLEARLQELAQAGLIAWSGHELPSVAPLARTRGEQMVSELLLENRE